jgi:tRNA pseudouridine(38-40) synthase
MRTIKLTLSYDGTDFSGFQRQSNARSVQQVLEEALASIEGGEVVVAGAGRTDSGVHALGQVASFRLASVIPADELRQALNATLSATGSNDVRVLTAEDAPDTFNARFEARAKLYRYRIVNADLIDPFERRFALHISRALNLDDMREAARALVGEHDFAAFQSGYGAGGRRPAARLRDWRQRLPEVHGPGHCRYAGRGRFRPALRRFGSGAAGLKGSGRGRPDSAASWAVSRSR